jgi:prepilin-type N-terminal cleavage/methylation domain-containing protein
MRAAKPTPRRGVTLLEMLVVVALVVIMMLILVQIFQVATGAISTSKTYQDLSNSLRMIDMTMRGDLSGVTARMTPPLDPKNNQGYFEYIENSFADVQGEDTDDILAFTAKAPEGQYFSGRIWIPATSGSNNVQPVTVTSQFAEIIWFVRNGNLYRRVLLVSPDRKGSLSLFPLGAGSAFYPGQLFGYPQTAPGNLGNLPVSWQGMNDISCRPSNLAGNTSINIPIPNTLGDLTERHNRAFRPRFSNDFFDATAGSGNFGNYAPDGSADDNNQDDIPDYYPTLYPNITPGTATVTLVNENSGYPSGAGRVTARSGQDPYQVLAFPYIYPTMYSKPDRTSIGTANGTFDNYALGWIHSPDPSGVSFNHAPLPDGDTLTVPSLATQTSTWWGFPTWRETMAGQRGNVLGWTDPVIRHNVPIGGAYTQRPGLQPLLPTNPQPVNSGVNFPPPIRPPFALNTPYGTDGAGSLTSFVPDSAFSLPIVWEDDLIMTGVRSFDVKAYDPDAPIYNRVAASVVYSASYQDLGYASPYLAAGYLASAITPGLPLYPMQDANFNPIGFGHEGRIPPLPNDNRVNPSRPYLNNVLGNGLQQPNNLGDSSASVIRMRRTFDTWSTTYTNAPSVDVNFNGSPLQAFPNDLPVYPSYPPPYPSALRGIQIQIRVVDPRDRYSKILTIRHDFSGKL